MLPIYYSSPIGSLPGIIRPNAQQASLNYLQRTFDPVQESNKSLCSAWLSQRTMYDETHRLGDSQIASHMNSGLFSSLFSVIEVPILIQLLLNSLSYL